MANRTSGWIIVGSIASVVAAVWIVLSPPGLWELYESGRLSGLVAAVAWLLPLLALAGTGWHWRERWKRWLRERYASAVYRAAWPVRDEVAARFVERDRTASGHCAGETGSALEQLGRDISDLEIEELLMLELILRLQDVWLAPPLIIGPDDVRSALLMSATDDDALRSGGRVCRRLQSAGLLERWEYERQERHLLAWLAERIKPLEVAALALELVRTELFEREVGRF